MLESVIDRSPEVVHYICKRFDIKMSKRTRAKLFLLNAVL